MIKITSDHSNFLKLKVLSTSIQNAYLILTIRCQDEKLLKRLAKLPKRKRNWLFMLKSKP